MTQRRAADYGAPLIRLRRLPDHRGVFRTSRRYEVEFTPAGATSPEWTRETDDPQPIIEPYFGLGDAHALIDAADRSWDGGVGTWQTLYPGDR